MTALAETALLFLLSGAVDLRGRTAAPRRAAAYGRGHGPGFHHIGGLDRGRFFPRATLNRVAKATSSEALQADALHFSSDMWSSVAVLIGLAGVAAGYAFADAAAAIVVAVFICIAGWRLGRRTIDTLTDTAPAGVSERVASIARQVSGVVAVERVRARPAGAVLFVELGVAVSRTLPLDRVTAIKEELTPPSAPNCRRPKSPSPPRRARSTTKPCASASW